MGSSRSHERKPTRVGEAQKERLAFIELHAYFCGEIRRADLEARFRIKPAAATRDFQTYRLLAPRNLDYDTSAKNYVPGAGFKPLFGFETSRVLSWLTHGFGDGLQERSGRPIASDSIVLLSKPHLDTLALVTRAIHLGKSLSIRYWSLSNGESKRSIVPFALVDSGLRWHVRAYDRSRGRFSDFVLSRIFEPKTLEDHPAEHECQASDHQWNRMVDLLLVPHPGLQFPAAIKADYQIAGKAIRHSVRAAVAGYFLHRWQVDCTADHSLDPAAHHLWLENTQTLYGVESAVMAPGYSTAINANPRSEGERHRARK
jgi:predicted DNA-binding transcriptional regulator YafY